MKRGDLPVLPTTPGCYLFHRADGTVIYVGKAVNLRSRVGSYFGTNVADKVRMLRRDAAYLDFIVTKDEVEALILEGGRHLEGAVAAQCRVRRLVVSYRVNDCALPASTLMMLPVDFAEASEAKK